ncbi:ABC transporter permease subunit [Agarivorans litoreus]|uniref:ABC transporter permease subunit n=1 Tax=Agarivorans litoreus TaxID=1510455 RepID=UPI001C7D377D|nr:ABC transporter permease subunit [Agarivorans litoreus]
MTQSVSFNSSAQRLIKDRLTRYSVSAGGIVVLLALILIFFYLLYVVAPIFYGASLEKSKTIPLQDSSATVAIGVEEQNEIAYRFNEDGQLRFFNLIDSQREFQDYQVEADITASDRTVPNQGLVAYGTSDGLAYIVSPKFGISYPNDKRLITPGIAYPMGEQALVIDPQGQAIEQLAFERQEESAVVAAVTADGRGLLVRYEAEEDMFSESLEWLPETANIPSLPSNIDQILVTPDLRRLYIRNGNQLANYNIQNIDNVRLNSVDFINSTDSNVTDIALLTGASSLIVANDNGKVSQWFDVAKDGVRKLTKIREFDAGAKVNEIGVEYFRKGFAVSGDDGSITIFHTTGGGRLVREMTDAKAFSLAFSPRASGLLTETENGLEFYHVDNEHPEVTWRALWSKIWYEGYPEPQYVWQSTSASDDFEPKLSLVPISFGTIKAAFYAMLFAAPIALAGAIYTAYFMSAPLRKVVKPTVEIMEALPTVILGFLAGLWLAPLIEDNLPGVIAIMLLLPVGFLLTAFAWSKMPKKVRQLLPEGWDAIVLIPVVLFIGWGCIQISPALEQWMFDGDARLYLTNELGINFDQRNSMVVGLAMGFAVIPTIFSIAEDAIFSVPKHLSNGSLALGATPWQTLTKVVILTASPGIFSAVMMGLGRAVGETMIVLMATGNTPVMDWSIFQGMRTLSANIAVEMPESEVGSSHYRVLFLAAFVLFVFTFAFNTIAEFVRQRLRDKYSSL